MILSVFQREVIRVSDPDACPPFTIENKETRLGRALSQSPPTHERTRTSSRMSPAVSAPPADPAPRSKHEEKKKRGNAKADVGGASTKEEEAAPAAAAPSVVASPPVGGRAAALVTGPGLAAPR